MNEYLTVRVSCKDCTTPIGRDRFGFYGPKLAQDAGETHAKLFGHHVIVETHCFASADARKAFEDGHNAFPRR